MAKLKYVVNNLITISCINFCMLREHNMKAKLNISFQETSMQC